MNQRQTVNVAAGKPATVYPNDGIVDYYNTQLELRYPFSDEGKWLTIAFGNASGIRVSQILQLPERGIRFQFQCPLELRDHRFDFLEFSSKDDLTLEIVGSETDGGFMP